jgi:hypothetical protein
MPMKLSPSYIIGTKEHPARKHTTFPAENSVGWLIFPKEELAIHTENLTEHANSVFRLLL